MTYQVIARKWRPQTFDEVTGQEPITRTLRNAIEHQRIHHAYLFSGARGVGKTTTARLLAKALNCHKADLPTPTPCRTDDPDACTSCSEISESRSPYDVREIDAASYTGIDNVRETIIATLSTTHARDRYKIFIIDEVHMLSHNSFNALLKTLEEPPPGFVFIMATTERQKVPETILSRCQQFEFRTIATAKILERLRLIAEAEKISIPDEALREIARSGEGSMRDAQSAFDQVISFAGNTINPEDVELALGVPSADILIRVVNGIANHQPAEALAVVDDVVMRGHDLRNFCRELLAHFRDLLVTRVSGSEELLESAICEPEELRRQAALFSESDLVRFFHSLAETETLLKTAAHPRYQLEVGLVKLMEMRRLEPLSQLVERLSALEESVRTGKELAGPLATAVSRTVNSAKISSAPAARAASPPQSTTAKAVAAGVAEIPRASVSIPREEPTAAEVFSMSASADASEIDRIKTALEGRRKMFLVTALDGATKAIIEADELFIEFAPEARFMRDTLAKPDNVTILREVCKEITERELGVRFVIKDQETDNVPVSKEEAGKREKKRLREKVEQDPTVQQMLRTFRGEVAEIRTAEKGH